jgi:alpha-glucan,water dikinase
MNDFKDGVVGAKSKNLGALRGQLPDWVSLPSSVTLPFGCFEEALDDPVNKGVKDRLKKAARQVSDGPAPALQECRYDNSPFEERAGLLSCAPGPRI